MVWSKVSENEIYRDIWGLLFVSVSDKLQILENIKLTNNQKWRVLKEVEWQISVIENKSVAVVQIDVSRVDIIQAWHDFDRVAIVVGMCCEGSKFLLCLYFPWDKSTK